MECKDNISGIKEIFLNEFTDLPRSYFIDNNFDLSGFKRIDPKQLFGSTATQNYNSFAFDQLLSFKTPKLINDRLIEGYPNKVYRAIVRDYKGVYWLLGKENGLTLKSIKSGTGSGLNEFSGYEIELEGKERDNFKPINVLRDNPFLSSSFVLSSSNILSSSQFI